ncbi:LA_0364 family Cys-rich lipoprotein [Leptospira paudalimensis]|uniref:LA_0364 family Cys-rich lipoprotein n=1 Tax=Leptospira paudalimensis TaxID=2950024 RepID=UPI0038996C34
MKGLIGSFTFVFLMGCGAPFSFRSACYERNKCSTIEGACFLRNDAFYRVSTGASTYSNADLAAIVGSCLGLEKVCRKNCESGTLF